VTAGVIVGGYCSIGENCFIGINSSLRNRISIGTGVFVGMGAVVTKSFQDGVTIIGNPARIKE
jgi:UDP-3-O-[3-hydroxymyristoyl] glucosamine N-acyltransferase